MFRTRYDEVRKKLPHHEEVEAVTDSRVRWGPIPRRFLLKGYVLVLTSERLAGFYYTQMGRIGRPAFEVPRGDLQQKTAMPAQDGKTPPHIRITGNGTFRIDLLLDPRRTEEARRIRQARIAGTNG